VDVDHPGSDEALLMSISAAALPAERPCRFCGYPFVPEDPGQLYCDEWCEFIDRMIDEAEARREERRDGAA
jgi:hypothetical protein